MGDYFVTCETASVSPSKLLQVEAAGFSEDDSFPLQQAPLVNITAIA